MVLHRTTGRGAPPPESAALTRAVLSAWLAVALAVLPAVAADHADKKEKEGEARKVTGKELVAMGFFQDFEELDLESLLKPQEVTVSVASRGPQPIEQAPRSPSSAPRRSAISGRRPSRTFCACCPAWT
jgi:hypothetical protein